MANKNQSSQVLHKQKHSPSITLKRESVGRPSNNDKNKEKITSSKIKLKRTIKRLPAISKTGLDSGRLIRAKSVEKSPKISRFNHPAVIEKKTATTLKTGYQAKNFVPLEDYFNEEDDELFNKAIRRANLYQRSIDERESINKPSYSGFNRKIVVAAVTGLVIFMGFLTIVNLPNSKSVILSRSTGFMAQIPSFSLAGFSQTNQVSKMGLFSTTYSSNTDNRNYSIEESPTSMSSTQLKNSYVSTHYRNYIDLRYSQTEIFISSNLTQATWIKNNVWFKLSNNSALSLNQISKLALSN